MQRVRRLAPVVAVALLGGVVLAGCRSAPDVAAYVGSERVTEEQVDDIIDNFNAGQAAPATPASPGPADSAPARQLSRTEVVTTLVLQQVCDELKAKKGFTVTPVPADQVASQEGLPPNSAYAKSRADLWSCLTGGVAT